MIDTKRKYGKMKQDDYDYLASTFFDNKKQKEKKYSTTIIVAVVLSVVFFSCLLIFLTKKSTTTQALSLYIGADKTPLTIAFDFSAPGSSKLRSVSFDLGDMDAVNYKALKFSVKSEKKATLPSSMRVVIENEQREKDAQFITDITMNWKEFTLPLEKFSRINSWSRLASIQFVIDEWNVAEKKNTFFIDEVHFSR